MSLAKSTPRPAGRVYTCKIGLLIEDDDDPTGAAQNVARHMADRDNSIRSLATWLGVSETTVHKHRNGYCACGRDS